MSRGTNDADNGLTVIRRRHHRRRRRGSFEHSLARATAAAAVVVRSRTHVVNAIEMMVANVASAM